jgi:Ca-activated chloride channel homolog
VCSVCSVVICVCVVSLFFGVAWANPLIDKTRQGNKYYTQGKYDAALNEYLDAQLDYPESEVLHFNIGDVLFKQKKYREASEEYHKALQSKNRSTQAKAYYNLGNCKFRGNDFSEAVEQYKKALGLNPNDQESKFNLEMARRKLKESSQQNQQSQQSKQNKQNQQNQQNSQQQSQEKKEKQDQQQKNNPPQQDPNQNMASGKPDEKKENQDSQKMSKEDALRILRSLEDREKKPQEQNNTREGREVVEHDW